MAEAAKAACGGKRRRGVVVSKSGSKTIVVRVERRVRHPVYGKVVRQMRKFHAHDERDTAKVGDVVNIAECRPMSRLKRWRLVEVVGSVRRDTMGASAE
jgi:small subunit ribosomal protein S17